MAYWGRIRVDGVPVMDYTDVEIREEPKSQTTYTSKWLVSFQCPMGQPLDQFLGKITGNDIKLELHHYGWEIKAATSRSSSETGCIEFYCPCAPRLPPG
jgi:hypothetical protein